MQLIECVPNFSEGIDLNIIKQITNEIEAVEGVRLLSVDPGKATNRTVVTFVGTPQAVVDRLQAETAKTILLADFKERLARLGADPTPLSPAAFAEFIALEQSKYQKLVKISGARVD